MIPQSRTTRLFSHLLPVAMLLATANLYADSPISMSLTGAAEIPPVTTTASGKVNVSVLPNRTVSCTIDVTGMAPTMAHIHEGAVGKNGPPIIILVKKSDEVFTAPADAKLSEAQYISYLAGNLYVNVHSEAHPNGEIRAQLPGKPIRIAH